MPDLMAEAESVDETARALLPVPPPPAGLSLPSAPVRAAETPRREEEVWIAVETR